VQGSWAFVDGFLEGFRRKLAYAITDDGVRYSDDVVRHSAEAGIVTLADIGQHGAALAAVHAVVSEAIHDVRLVIAHRRFITTVDAISTPTSVTEDQNMT
jgi:hypothetical protein